jgi:hypothetical protein
LLADKGILPGSFTDPIHEGRKQPVALYPSELAEMILAVITVEFMQEKRKLSWDPFGKFLGRQPIRAGYCVDCLSQLYGEPVEAIDACLAELGITSRQAHCGNCGEHKDAFLVPLPRSLMR